MRNMSFALTTQQFKDRTKTVTRRKGWKFLKAGDEVMGCVKCMGMKPGEKLERLGPIKIVQVWREPLRSIKYDDVKQEGFPGMTKDEFIEMFCLHMGGDEYQMITRIEYEYLG